MKTIIASCHHRSVRYHDEGLKFLKDAGYEMVLQDTFGRSYDYGMMNFKRILPQFDIVVFIDNDLFLYGLNYFNQLLEDFKNGDYGFCSYLVSDADWHYKLEGTIAPITDQAFKDTSDIYKFRPEPHWENAYMMIRRDVWDKLTMEDLRDSRNMVKEIYETGTKMGAHKAGYKWAYSHYGPEWFHVGCLMRYFYYLEQTDFGHISYDSDIDASRIGFFLSQRNDFGSAIYSDDINRSLGILTQQKGEQFFINKWKELTTV